MNALQNLLFCIPKAAVLHGKSVDFASQKSRFRVHRIIALVSSYNPSKINSKYFSSLNPYAFLFIIFILLFIPSTLALDTW
nr:hypothetical protein [Prevotella intermedia]